MPSPGPGRRFFVLTSLVALVSYALAFAAGGLGVGYFHLAAAGLLAAYNVVLRPQGSPLSTLLIRAAVVLGAAGLVEDAISARGALPGLGGGGGAYLAAAALTSAALLGSALVAMVLGHWYLVARGLSFDFLERLVIALFIALALRAGAAAAATVAQREWYLLRWESLGGTGFWTSYGFFLGAWALFGILAPLALAWMALRCVRERSNQSATGILYVVVAFVLAGEIIAKHLLHGAGVLI